MLPPLRSELSLHQGPTERDGSPTWTIRDPVRNRFFRLDWSSFEVLSRWSLGDPKAIAEAISTETTLELSEEDVIGVAELLVRSQLTQPCSLQEREMLIRYAEAEQQSWFQWLLHHYLFFRIPLLRPDRWLSLGMPWVRWLGAGWFRLLTLGALLLGLILIGRQWDLFVATFVETLSPSGLLSYALALSFVKVIHELSHGFTAKNYGCRVPSMGLAFLVMWPVLYTDVNDTWMLPERRKRLYIGSAGILAELTVAAWATLAWVFLPEGPLKQAAFVLATLTWVSSLIINLSPFMRFDGYFIAMDALEMPNLHPRSFAMARWWLREALFDLQQPPPEHFSRLKQTAIILFAFAVWIYRLALFLGIAALVYHFFIKAVGVLLFAVELGWFIWLPIWREMQEWKAMRTTLLSRSRVRWTAACLASAFLFMLIPWQSTIRAPAVLKSAQTTELYLPFPAAVRSVSVTHGQAVHQGDVLFTFASPGLELRKQTLLAQQAGAQASYEAAVLDPALRERLGVLQEEVHKVTAELTALNAEEARLVLTAPVDGTVYDLLPDMHIGDWLSSKQRLAVVVPQSVPIAIAYVQESDLPRLALGAEADFIPRSLDFDHRGGVLSAMDPSPSKVLNDEMLSSIHGGEIPSRVQQRLIMPDGAITRISITLTGPTPSHHLIGDVRIEGERVSMIGRFARSVMVVLLREWGA